MDNTDEPEQPLPLLTAIVPNCKTPELVKICLRLLRKYTRGFTDFGTAGEAVHAHLTAAGFEMKFLESSSLGKYIRHLNHATMILNPTGSGKTSKAKARRNLDRELGFPGFQEILADDSYDKSGVIE